MKGTSIIAVIARYPGAILTLALVVTLLAIPAASRLRIGADLLAMLPTDSPAAADYEVFMERFGGLEQVFVVVVPEEAGRGGAQVADEAELMRAARRLEERLTGHPEIASVRAGLRAEDERFLLRYVVPRAPLLLAGDWRETVEARIEPGAIRRRVARLRALVSSPAGAAEAKIARLDPLGFSQELVQRSAGSAIPIHPLTSDFVAPGGAAALVTLTPARPEIDPQGGRALAAALSAAFDEVSSELAAPVRFEALGGPLYAAQDEAVLRQDLQRTLTGSLVGTSAVLMVSFEGLVLPLAALAPLLAALVWAAAGLGLLQGGINAVSIGFGAVLVGLGVDYGIHGVARFRQSMLELEDAGAALFATLRRTGPAIVTSAATTAAGFAVLGLAHLRPLQELGRLVALGIVCVLVAVATVGSALAVVVARKVRPPGRSWRALGSTVSGLVGFAEKFPRPVLATAVVLSVVAAWSLGGLALDTDPRTLRPAEHPALAAEELLTRHFGLGLDTATLVVSGSDLPRALSRARVAGEVVRSTVPEAHVSTPGDVLTAGEALERRLREIAELPMARAADDLERELRAASLDPRAFGVGLEALRSLGRGEDPGAPPAAAWPDWLSRSIKVSGDGAWAALSLRLPPESWPDGPPPELLARLEEAVPGSALASAVAIGRELKILAHRDLVALSGWALLAVSTVVAVSFRGNLRLALGAGLPVTLGCLWTVGLWSALGRSLDLFTLAVLPILLGIGIDDGLHLMHGAREDPVSGVRGAAEGAGRALLLTTLTTAVGFASLGWSSIPGLRNGGLMIAFGVVACLLATLMVLPALEAVARRAS